MSSYVEYYEVYKIPKCPGSLFLPTLSAITKNLNKAVYCQYKNEVMIQVTKVLKQEMNDDSTT